MQLNLTSINPVKKVLQRVGQTTVVVVVVATRLVTQHTITAIKNQLQNVSWVSWLGFNTLISMYHLTIRFTLESIYSLYLIVYEKHMYTQIESLLWCNVSLTCSENIIVKIHEMLFTKKCSSKQPYQDGSVTQH